MNGQEWVLEFSDKEKCWMRGLGSENVIPVENRTEADTRRFGMMFHKLIRSKMSLSWASLKVQFGKCFTFCFTFKSVTNLCPKFLIRYKIQMISSNWYKNDRSDMQQKTPTFFRFWPRSNQSKYLTIIRCREWFFYFFLCAK